MRRLLQALYLTTLGALVLGAQQPQRSTTPAAGSPQTQTPPPIRVTTQLIVEEVRVKDKSGKPIEGLTPNDFVLTEDGVPQTISFVEFKRREPQGTVAPASPSEPIVPTAPPATTVQIAPEQPGDARYRDRRLLALYFDMSTMQ